MNTISVAISRDEDAQHDLVLGFGTKGTIISGLSEADLLEIRSAIDCAVSKGEDDAHARLIAAAPELLEALKNLENYVSVHFMDIGELGHIRLRESRAAIAKTTGGAR
jgi:hypothetical protein